MFKPLRFAVLLAGVTLAVSVWAQPAPDEGPDQTEQAGPTADPPTRVARLAYLNGDVSFVPAGENDWVEAQLNRPLITGDKLWSDRGSRAELNLGEASMRIDQNTSFDFLNLDDNVAQVELTQGSLNLHVRRLYDNQTYEIDTPTLAFVINRVGEFRVDVLPNGQATVVTVLQGAGDAYGEGGARFRIEEGQSVTFNDPQLQDYESADIPRPDDFDNFVEQRDHRWDSSSSRRYVSEEVIGYEDLDDNGEWSDVPEYGSVWYPTTVSVGWTPYHYGHWGWVGAYGWTWIDDASWGFAPFHYGRWAYVGGRWGWCPGPAHVRAVYAPALVAFVGGGVSVSVGFGTGPVGWFPLGPRDVYFPSYRVSQRYFTSINISNTRVINNVTINNYYGGYRSGRIDYEHINYANRHVAGAVVAVPHDAFVNAHPVGRAAIAVNQQTFANARVSSFAAVAPTRTSLIGTAAVARAAPPAQVVNRPIVAATKPPAPVAPFAQRQAVLAKNPGQPLPVTQLHRSIAGPGATPAGGSALAARQNVKVVTNAGAPLRAAAPVLPARAAVGANNAATGRGPVNANTLQSNRQLPAVQNQQNNAGGNNNIRGNANTLQSNRQLPAVQNQQNQNAVGAAANTGRPNATQHLDSARFAHPGGAATTGGGANAATGQQPARTVNAETLQRDKAGGGQNRYTQGERATLNNNAVNNPAATHAGTPTTARPVTNLNAEKAAGGNNANAYTRENNGYNRGGNAVQQNRPEYHAPIQQQQSHVDAAHVQQSQQYHVEPKVQQQPQYNVQKVPQNNVQTQQQQYHPQSNVNQTQMGQGFQPQHQPQPQHVQPPANQGRPQVQPKDKKDDDKHGH